MTDKDAFDRAFAPNDRAIVRSFVRAWTDHGQPVLFAGAGLSKNARPKPTAPNGVALLTWQELTHTLKYGLTGGDPALEKKLPTNDLRLAELYEASHHRSLLLDRITEAIPAEHFEPGALHERLVRLPWAAVVTTNFEDLVERAFAKRRTVRKVVWDSDLPRRRSLDSLLVIKMHGDLADPRSIVITEEDYRRYQDTRPGVAVKVKQLLLEHPLLFIGFSLSDPNFATIDGWIRDAVRDVKLPALALMNTPVLPAERTLWQRRGIHVVEVCEDLVRAIDALHEESNRKQESVAPIQRDAERADTLAALVRDKPAGWQRRVAAELALATDMFAIRHVVDGQVERCDLDTILATMTESERRDLLLRAHEAGMSTFRVKAVSERRPGEVATTGDESAVDIVASLLDDSRLPDAQRVRVQLRRARAARLKGELETARAALVAARDLADSHELRELIDLEERQLVVDADDVSVLMQWLAIPGIQSQAFAACRRGSEALVAVGAEAAEPWFRQALAVACNGDEETSALMGLAACLNWLEENARVTELEEKRRAIRADERPRVEQVWDRQSTAGVSFASGSRGSALHHIRLAIDSARTMGWPRSPRVSQRTALDGLIGKAIRMLLHDDATNDEIREAFALHIEYSYIADQDILTADWVTRFTSDADNVNWLRRLLEPRPQSPPGRALARQVLSSICLAVLPDEAITRHIEQVVLNTRATSDSDDVTVRLHALHVRLLEHRWWNIPFADVQRVVQRAAEEFDRGGFGRGIDASSLPFRMWAEAGALGLGCPALETLVGKLSAKLHDARWIAHWRNRSVALRVFEHLNIAQLLPTDVRDQLVAELFQMADRAHEAGRGDELLDLVLTLCELPNWTPTQSMSAALIRMYESNRDSTGMSAWSFAVGAVAPYAADADLQSLLGSVRGYVQLALHARADSFAHLAVWAGQMVCGFAKARPDLIGIEDVASILVQLAKKDAESVVAFADLAPSLAANGRAEMLDQIVVAGSLHPSGGLVFNWVDAIVSPAAPSETIQDFLLTVLLDSSAVRRMRAYHSLYRLVADGGRLSESRSSRLVSVALRFGCRDSSPMVRGAAARVLGLGNSQDADTELSRLGSDPIASVRRFAEFATVMRRRKRGTNLV